jgi:hypothetical protein
MNFHCIRKILLFADLNVIQLNGLRKVFKDCVENYCIDIWNRTFDIKNLILAAKYDIRFLLLKYDNSVDNPVIIPFFILYEAVRWGNYDFAHLLLKLGEKYDHLFIDPFFQALVFNQFKHPYAFEILEKYNVDPTAMIYPRGENYYESKFRLNPFDCFMECLPMNIRSFISAEPDFNEGNQSLFCTKYVEYVKSNDEGMLNELQEDFIASMDGYYWLLDEYKKHPDIEEFNILMTKRKIDIPRPKWFEYYNECFYRCSGGYQCLKYEGPDDKKFLTYCFGDLHNRKIQ